MCLFPLYIFPLFFYCQKVDNIKIFKFLKYLFPSNFRVGLMGGKFNIFKR